MVWKKNAYIRMGVDVNVCLRAWKDFLVFLFQINLFSPINFVNGATITTREIVQIDRNWAKSTSPN